MMSGARSIAVLMLVAAGCVGTDVGNPPDDRRITATLEFEASVPSNPTALLTPGGAEISEAWVSLDAIRVSQGDCVAPDEVTIPGPFYVELVSRTVIPEPPVIAEYPGVLCSLRLDVGPALASDAPAELEAGSLLVRGSDGDGAFVVRSSTGRTLPYIADFELVDSARFVDTFDPTQWVDQLNGSHEVGDDSPAIVNNFWNTLRRQSRIVRDSDENGTVSAVEFDQPFALPE